MRAIVIAANGQLELRDVPTPEPGPGQARVRIRACGVNRADLLQRRGAYPAPSDAPADIPGLEIAGEVDAIGSHSPTNAASDGLRVGDRVYGIVSGGAYAEQVVVHARTLAPIPSFADGAEFSFTDAAAIPEAFLTAYDAMVSQAGLAAGESVLVHAVGSGVGTAAVQIARAIGAHAIGTARSKEKLERAKAFGMTHGIAIETGEGGGGGGAGGSAPIFADRVREAVASLNKAGGGHRAGGVDVVLELVGGAYVPESLASLAHKGRLVLVGLMAGARADIDLGIVLRQRLRIFGTVLRSRPLEEKILAAQVLARNINPLVAAKKLVPIVDRVLPLAQADEAMALMASNTSFGKIILRVD